MNYQAQLDIPHDELRLVRVGKPDSQSRSDDFLTLRQFVLRSEEAYPSIGRWFDTRVSRGLRTGERIGFIGLINERPVAAGILKRGQTTKFCHLKVDESERTRALGDLLFTMMSLDVRHTAERVRFTLPESVWESHNSFFRSFSFLQSERADRQYRLFDTELYSETPFTNLFDATKAKLRKLFGHMAIGNHSLLTGGVLGFNAPALEKIFSKKTSVEIRTRFSKRWEHSKISLYTTGPVAGLAGEATISRVIDGHPNTIWEHFGSLTGHSRAEYDAFFGNQSLVQALLLSDVRPFPDIVSLTQLSHLLGIDLPAPKGFLSLENKDGWMSAVVLAAALQGAIKIPALAKSPRENIQTVETFGGGRCNSAVPLAARTHFG